MEDKTKCASCIHELDIGADAIKVDEGVIGVKDFVPLEKTLLFCSEKCVRDYFDMGDLPSLPPRIPR
jgi:hypothetical protein